MIFFRFIFISCLFPIFSFSQVTSVVYFEDFNSGTVGWVIGGYNPSWKYGIPTLPNIPSNGTPCFATGDAGTATSDPFASCQTVTAPTTNGNFYNCCERSFVESPVIDLSSVNSPLLSVDINLHCEQTFDGAKLQLSTNGGSSWQDVGNYTSIFYQTFPSSINCREKNWYNKNSINYLSNTSGGCGNVNYVFTGGNAGWSGGCAQSPSGACQNPDNHGTNGWITATHCIPQAANKSNVKVRVVFGAGSQVYADGIAFDNVTILNVFPIVDFAEVQQITCGPEISFINNSDCAAIWSWDFGHPNAPGNLSNLQNPTHTFPQPGSYVVSLTATDFCGGISAFSSMVNVNPGTGPVITAADASSIGLCNSSVDSIIISLSPVGQPPFEISYIKDGVFTTIQGLMSNPIVLTNLTPGVYEQIEVIDFNGCSSLYPDKVIIATNSDGIMVDAGNDVFIESGEMVQLMATSNMPANFSWSPVQFLSDPDILNPVSSPIETTTYTVTATSLNGCTATDFTTVYVTDTKPCNRFFIPNTFTPNGDGKNDKLNFVTDPAMKLEYYQMNIYNRWGFLVYQSTSQSAEWDGGDHPTGVYAVTVNLRCENKKSLFVTRTVNLIR